MGMLSWEKTICKENYVRRTRAVLIDPYQRKGRVRRGRVRWGQNMFQPSDPSCWLPEYLLDTSVGSEIGYVHTLPLTKFERASVVGHRALQIAQNSRVRVASTSTQPLQLALEELNAGSLPPTSVGRYLPDGTLVRKTVQEQFRQARS